MQRPFRKDASQPGLQLVLEYRGGLGERPLAGRREFHDRGAPIVGVGAPTAVTGLFDAVDELAGATDGDDQLVGDVLDAARVSPGHHLHRFETSQRKVQLRAQPRIDGVPYLGLKPDQFAEQFFQVHPNTTSADITSPDDN